MVSELALGRDLFTIRQEAATEQLIMSSEFLLFCTDHLTNAVTYLHNTMRVVHGDIKPENVLIHLEEVRLEQTNDADFVIPKHLITNLAHPYCKPETAHARLTFQLGDFGSAIQMDTDAALPKKSVRKFRGTLHYIAPEFLELPHSNILEHEEDAVDIRAQDMWALGLTFWFVLLPEVEAIRHNEITPVLPCRLGGVLDDCPIDFVPKIWLHQQNLARRFHEAFSKKYGGSPPRLWRHMITGLTMFEAANRFTVNDLNNLLA